MRMHTPGAVGALAAILVLLLAGVVGAGPREEGASAPAKAAAPAFAFTKRDLAASYKPYRVHGVDWYERIGAARLRGERRRKKDGEERLIFQMRMLGPMDGAT